MVFLVLNRLRLDDALALAKHAPTSIWCSANVIIEKKFDQFIAVRLTRCEYFLDSTDEILNHTLATIEEHHSGERIWTERGE